MNGLNVICICLDTFRADMVGPGQKLSHVATPYLDDFASGAVVFDRAFGEGQPTLQMRRSALTGRRSFPWRFNFDKRGNWHHAPGWHKIPPDQDTLAEMLLDRGYMTGLVADTYHMFKSTMNYVRGFATYDFVRGQESDNWRFGSLSDIEAAMKRHVRQPIDWDRHATLIQYLFNQRFRASEEDYQCARVFRRAAEWLDENAGNAPFFLWVDSFDPHEPWDPPKEYADKYCPGYEGLDFIMPGAAHEGDGPTPEETERTKALYFGEVTLVDRWVGHLLEKVDQLKLWDRTIVMVTSDHGTQVLDHGSFGKGGNKLQAFNTRLNWMVRHPEVEPRHASGLVQSHDMLPTIMGLLKVPCDQVDGVDVWPLATGQEEAVRDHAVIGWAGFSSGAAGGHASVRDDRWNYTVDYTDPQKQEELFDLKADPDEAVNVAADHPEVVARQRERVEAVLRQSLPAQLPEACDHPIPSPGGMYLQRRKRWQT